MTAPQGLGIWIAFAASAGGHEHIGGSLAQLGAQWVAPRGGVGALRDGAWSSLKAKAAVSSYHDAGLRVYPWLFSRPSSYLAEVNLFRQFIDEGADGVIIDAEVSWDSGQKTTALHYMDALDKALPDAFIADAPWAYPSYHPNFPFAEFAQRVNARMPQAYWTEFDNRGARYHLPRIDAEWADFHAKNPDAQRPVWPVGVTYGREHPSHPPGIFTLADLQFFLDRYDGSPASLYTYEAALYASRAVKAPTLGYLKSRAADGGAPSGVPTIL